MEEVRPDLVMLVLNLIGELDGIETFLRMKTLPNAPRVLVHAAFNLAMALLLVLSLYPILTESLGGG